MLQRDEEINAVSYIIDKKYLNSLSDDAKQRYLLTTLDKYRMFKQRYENERNREQILNC